MQFDLKKLKRQTEGFELWRTGIAKSPVWAGILEYPTGFGKTMVSVLAIQSMNSRHPERTTIVVVPSTKLYNDWMGYSAVDEDGNKTWIPGHIEKHKLKMVTVYVVNTYIKYASWACDLFILDEVHHYLSRESKFFSTVISITKYRWGMGLSATITEEQEEIAGGLGWSIIDKITPEEAELHGWITPALIYALGIPLSPEDLEFNKKVNDDYRYYASKFNYNFNLIRACSGKSTAEFSVEIDGKWHKKTGKDWREYWARVKGFNGSEAHPSHPSQLVKYAAQAMATMAKRKERWQNSPTKLPYIKALCTRFDYFKTVIFSETSDFAERVVRLFPHKCRSYHSNLVTYAIKGDEKIIKPAVKDKKFLKAEGYTIKTSTEQAREALSLFGDPDSGINLLSVVKALDEGYDEDKIRMIIQVAYNSTKRQGKQRTGRATRIDYENANKKAVVVYFYMIGTREEKWLRDKLSETRLIRWITSIDQIRLTTTKIYAESVSEATGKRPDAE